MENTLEPKSFLYAWLGKVHNVTPVYNIRTTGKIYIKFIGRKNLHPIYELIICFSFIGLRQRQRFLCELSVPGFPYVAAGNSTSKKDAQTNSAKDFIQFLLRTGKLASQDVPQQVSV